MVRTLVEKHIPDIALAQKLAWQKAFRGILSDRQLDELRVQDFAAGWQQIILRPERTNLIFHLPASGRAIGFLSYGPPYAANETATTEIYGLYVHPAYWGTGSGIALMDRAIIDIRSKRQGGAIILWVMEKNKRARRFYKKSGFRPTGHQRLANRNEEEFSEVKYQFDV